MARIFKTADQLIGGTPLLELSHIEAADKLLELIQGLSA